MQKIIIYGGCRAREDKNFLPRKNVIKYLILVLT